MWRLQETSPSDVEHLTPEGNPIFCVCEAVPKYHFIRHNVTHRNCEYYEPYNDDV